MKNIFIAGPAEISLFSNDTLISVSKTMLNTSINIETSSEDIRGGFGALLLGKYFHSSNMTMELEDSMFRIEWLKSSLGANAHLGDDTLISESITLGENKIGVLKNVPAIINGQTLAWIEKGEGSFDEIMITNNNNVYSFIYNNGTIGKKYCVKYYTYNDEATTLTVSANIIPEELKAIAKCQLFAGSKNALNRSSRVGYLYIEIPRFILNGGTSLSLTHTGASTSPLSGSALATDSPDGCDEGGYYAKIIKVEQGNHWYDNVDDIIIVNNDIELNVGEQESLDVKAYSSMYSGYRPSFSDLDLVSLDSSISSITPDGVVTGMNKGNTYILAKVKNKPSVKAVASVTINKIIKDSKLDTGLNIFKILQNVNRIPNTIVFESEIPNIATKITKYDLSLAKDNSIIAYIDESNIMHWCSDGKIQANEDSSHLFLGFSSLTSIQFNNVFDTSLCTNMSYMFDGDKYLSSLDVSSFIMDNVTDISYMFSRLEYIKNIDISGWNTINVVNPSSCFYFCRLLEAITGIDSINTSNFTTIKSMFAVCQSLIELNLSKWDVSNVTDMTSAFNFSSSTSEMPTIINVSNWNTQNVTSLNSLFSYSNVIGYENFNTSNVTNMYMTFSMCKMLSIDISKWDTSNVTNMNNMFIGSTIKEANISGINVNKIDRFNIFTHCKLLENITGLEEVNFNNITSISFLECNSISGTITIPTILTSLQNEMFNNTSTIPPAKLVVNYSNETKDVIDTYIATKSAKSNVVKGINVDEIV